MVTAPRSHTDSWLAIQPVVGCDKSHLTHLNLAQEIGIHFSEVQQFGLVKGKAIWQL